MSTFGGWTIVSMPSSPPPKSVEWQLDDTVGVTKSPFSLQQQTYVWNASILRASVSYPIMPSSQAAQWIAFLMGTQGIANIFSFGDPANLGPQNGAAVAGSVVGSGQTGYSLITSSSLLTPGDWIQLGLRLYMVTSVSGGTLGIWPQIRESPASGTNLIITNTQGLFRLQKNQRSYRVEPGRIYSITFEIEEAL